MRCRVCRQDAIIDLRRHNANFCSTHLLKFCRDQVTKAIDEHNMFGADDHVLVAVSGGKDSLALWDLLVELGYRADGVYIGLGIGQYSDASAEYARGFAEKRDLALVEVDLKAEYGYDIETGSKAAKRAPCSTCGLSKRRILDRAAVDGGYDVLVTGHNLDDEAAVLLGNALHWNADYLSRQRPVLPARMGMPRKVKPLIRLDEREMAAYCVASGIEYIVEECPMSTGNRHLRYKEALNLIEAVSPGTKASFFHKFLATGSSYFPSATSVAETGDLSVCASCGSPTTADVCAFCRLVDRVGGWQRRGPEAVVVPEPKRAGFH